MSNERLAFANLTALAAHLRQEMENRKFILLYAYKGTVRTRLSGAFKNIGANSDEGARIELCLIAVAEEAFLW